MCGYMHTEVVRLLTWGLPRSHGQLSHAGRHLRGAWGDHATLAGHYALLLESCPSLLLQLLLDLVDLLCQQMVVFRLERIITTGQKLFYFLIR